MAVSSMSSRTLFEKIPFFRLPPRDSKLGFSRIGQHQATPGVYWDIAFATFTSSVKEIPLLEMEVPVDPVPQFQL